MFLDLYKEFIQNRYNQTVLLPRYQRQVSKFFIYVHKQIRGEVSVLHEEDLVRIIDKKEIDSDLFLFHILSVIEKASLRLLPIFLKRISPYEKLQSINIKNLDRIYGSVKLQEAIQRSVVDSSNNIQLYFHLLLLYNHGVSDLDQSSRFIWDMNRYKINTDRRGPFINYEKEIQLLMQKRSSIIINLIHSKPHSVEIIQLLKLLIPRKEFVQKNEEALYESAKLLLSTDDFEL